MSEAAAPTPAEPITITEVTTAGALAALAGEWAALCAASLDDEPFVTPEWIIPWWEAFGEGTLWVLAARRGAQLVGLAPFHIVPSRVLGRTRRVLRICANADSNRAHVIMDARDAPTVARAIVAHLATSPAWDVGRIGPLAREAESTRVLTTAFSDAGVAWGIRELHASPYLTLPGSWDEVLGTLSGSFRETLRRKSRKSEKDAAVTITTDPSAADAEIAFAISEETWQHAEGTGIGSTPRVEGFYRAMARAAAARGWLRVPHLSVAGRPVCFEFNLNYAGRLYNLKVGYRESEGARSPGLVLREQVLRRAVADGVAEYDFLGEAEPYKLHWTSTVRALGEIHLPRRGVRPRLRHWAWFTLRPLLERRAPWLLRLKRRLRPRRRASPRSEDR